MSVTSGSTNPTSESGATHGPGDVGSGPGPFALAATASIGAGAVHAAAIGVHQEHRQAALAFALLAVAQIGWGAVALVARRPPVAVAGVLVNAAAVAGWVLAKTTGIPGIDGLGEAEGIQWPDALAAGLAAASVALVLRTVLAGAGGRPVPVPGRVALPAVAVVVLAASVVGMTTSGSHSHADGHGGSEEAGHGHDSAADATGHDDSHDDGHGGPAVVAYDPSLPIDLSGTPGVSPEQQARAENLIALTLARLPRFADHRTAEAAGFHSIGDGFTGHEHFINWSYIDDEHVLDPDHPESLVYETGPGGRKTLVSAMFMLEQGSTLDDVPDLGGPLTQWHIHDDLCFTDDPVAPRVSGLTSVGGECPPPSQKFTPVPMIHVWITPHPCGPFAALEGVAAGQVEEGEEHLCDHAHGSGT